MGTVKSRIRSRVMFFVFVRMFGTIYGLNGLWQVGIAMLISIIS